VVDIAATARPWVVNIDIQRGGAFLGRVEGLGSGVILRSDGYILTSAHVVRDATSIEVTLASGEKLKARIVGIDDDTDVGVIKVGKQRLPAALVGSAKNLRVGDMAVAIGSPLGLEQTVTQGIISGLGRTVRAGSGSPPLVEMIQTDAPITHGNSGGALINGEGAVIGINTAIGTTTGSGEGIGFATPIDVSVAVAHELIATGRATHPWLGVTGSNITSATAERFGVSEGALMVQVIPNGPAGRAGIRPNDVVVSFDRGRIKSMDELIVAIRNHKVGQRVAIEVVRRGRHLTLYATLAEKPRSR
jgi:S1-C subfamily serine protease